MITENSYSGHGLSLRFEYFNDLLQGGLEGVEWFEIISENFMEPGGRPWRVLEKLRAEVPVVMHGVSLGIGNTDELSSDYLKQLRSLIHRVDPAMVSDHLCWGAFGGHQAHDLLPLPFNEESLEHVVQRVTRVQEALGRQILLENVSSYLQFRASDIFEAEFIAEVARRADCGILLDINNIIVSSANHGFDADEYLKAIPADRVGHFHLAGNTDKGDYILDSHIGPVPETVWDLYRRAVRRFGARPTLVEWDDQVPPFAVVAREAQHAARVEAEVLRG